MTQIVGIDLGTTNSLCAVFRDGQPLLIPNPHGEFLTPSVVGIVENGQVVVGAPARELRITRPERCRATFKRDMGSGRQMLIGRQTFSAVELSSLVLRSLKEDAESFLKGPVHEAVITVPAYFNDLQRKATRQAGEMAGLRVRRIINEPTAAALTYGFHDRTSDKKLLVIDLGGGTFDVTLMEVFDGTLEIIATAGESHLGGEDFTDALAASVLRGRNLVLEVVEDESPLLVSRLRQECEQAKRRLQTKEEVWIRIPDRKGYVGDNDPHSAVRVTREGFIQATKSLMERLKEPIRRVLRDGQSGPGDLDEVILVGGATRMLVLREFVTAFFQREPLCRHNPDEVVALGAAVQAALMADDPALGDMVMTDVCPFTLGVEVCRRFGDRQSDGYFSPIIHRNTTIPVSREEGYCTVEPNQNELLLNIYQGEARKVNDNLKLGELRVKGIPPGPAGQQVNVRFTYDLNGLLEVEARVSRTGEMFKTLLMNNVSLTGAELKAAIARMQALKSCPRDEVANRQLLLFAEKLVGEVNKEERKALEQALDQFEQALDERDQGQFQHTRQGLLLVLESLGFRYEEHHGNEIHDEGDHGDKTTNN